MRIPLLVLVLSLGTCKLPAGEVRVGLGVFNLAPKGADILVSFRPARTPWAFGVRHVQWMDTFEDPFTGRHLSETTERRTGVGVTYLFRPEAKGSWYLGALVYRWSKRERSLVFGDSNQASTTVPAAGGGYTRAFGGWFYWNLGLYLSPGSSLSTHTSTGSEEDHGSFDIQIQAGIRF